MKELPKYQFFLFFHLLLFRPLGPGDQAVHPTRCVLVAHQLLAVLHQTWETNIKNISSLKFRSFPEASKLGSIDTFPRSFPLLPFLHLLCYPGLEQ